MKRVFLTPMALAVLGMALYLPGFWWGAPHATGPDRTHSWGVDDETPLGPLAEMHNIIAPKPDRNLGYPLMSSFVMTAAYLPYLAYLRLTGRLKQINSLYPYGLADPTGTLKWLSLIAHLVSVLMAVGIVLTAYDAGRTLWDQQTGLITALFVMLSFPMFYYSRTGNVEIPVLFFTGLALAVFARLLARGINARRTAWLGCFVGLALATKEPAFASFLAIPAVLLILHKRQHQSTRWHSWEFWQVPVAGLAAAAVSFGIGSGLFVDPERYFAHVAFARQRLAEVAAGQVTFVHSYDYTLEGHWQLIRLIVTYLADAMTWPGLFLAVIGLAWALQRKRMTAALALPALTTLLMLFSSVRGAQLRYVMPVAYSLSFYAARAVVLGWQARQPLMRVGLGVTAFATLALALLRGVDLTHAMIMDSRYAAGDYLAVRAHSGTRVEYFGFPESLPPLGDEVVTRRVVENLRGVEMPRRDAATVSEISEALRTRLPDFVIIAPDLLSEQGASYSGACPPEIYQALLSGELGYRLAAAFQTPAVLPWVHRPALDYPVVNPPIRIFVPREKEVD